MANTDSLNIKITATATSAQKSLKELAKTLDKVSSSLYGINAGVLKDIATSVNSLGIATQQLNSKNVNSISTLARNLNKLSTFNAGNISSIGTSIKTLVMDMNKMPKLSNNAIAIGTLSNNLAKLGNSARTSSASLPVFGTALTNLITSLSKVPQVNNNIIQLINSMALLSSQGAKIGRAGKSITNGLNNVNASARRTNKTFFGLAATFGKFYANFFLLIRGFKALARAIDSTADYIEAYNYYNVALGKIGEEWKHQWEEYGYDDAEAYSKSFEERLTASLKNMSGLEVFTNIEGNGKLVDTGVKNLGMNIQEVTQYASQLASVTNSIGQTGEVSIATASAFTKLGADMSSLFNLDYSQVMGNLQSGLIGQSRALTYIAHKRSNVFKKTTLISGNSCKSKTIRSQVLNWKGSTTIEMVA